MLRLAALLACFVDAATTSPQRSVGPRPGVIEVPVTASHSVARKISSRLVLRLDRYSNAAGAVAGWDVAVDDKRQPNEGNLLYGNPMWHGPQPSQVSAWIVRDHLFPPSNSFDVRGHPWRVVVECLDCVTAGDGPDPFFISGTLRVLWSRR